MSLEQENHNPQAVTDLLAAFRINYGQLEDTLADALANETDPTILAKLGDDIDDFAALVFQNINIFDPSKFETLRVNIALMQIDIRQQYERTLEASHHGRPNVVEVVHTGNRGRPRIQIEPNFLRWAYGHRSTAGISRFLHVSRSTVRDALIEYGIAQPEANPFALASEDLVERDDLLDPNIPLPDNLPNGITVDGTNNTQPPRVVSFTGPLSSITDDGLDDLILRLRSHFHRAGISILDGMLRRLGHRVPRERIRQSLMRIDPVQRVFQRIRIRRRNYSVPGPNSLWHHDGQHGLIRWGIVIHGFINGYSRLIAGLRASNNNSAITVLDLFLRAAEVYGVPWRLRGDHGTENIFVAAWMEEHHGTRCGSYIWGRSVHNICIERLWVDVTAQVGAFWSDVFIRLELHHGLDITNIHHIWLLHHLFLETINQQLAFFAESWNQHRIQIRNGPNRSPADLFGFDMLVHGIRGDQLPDEELDNEELEVYGVDWEALHDESVLNSHLSNNLTDEGWTSWVGRTGPPENLNDVLVDPPSEFLTRQEVETLDQQISVLAHSGEEADIIMLWTLGLGHARALYGGRF